MKALSRRVASVGARLDPAPDPAFLAYARAVVAWSGGEPDEANALRLARALAGMRGGATWEGLVELAGTPGAEPTCCSAPHDHTTDRESRLH